MYQEAIEVLNKEILAICTSSDRRLLPGMQRAKEILRRRAGVENQEIRRAVEDVFDHYIEVVGKSHLYTLTPARRQKGETRLRELLSKTKGNVADAAELMKYCIDAMSLSDFHMGKNAQKRPFNDWEGPLFGSQERVERWLEAANRA